MMRSRDFDKWDRTQFCIETRRVHDPSTICKTEVDGIVSGGLGAHIANDRAHITHLASGRRVASFSTLGAALAFAYMVSDRVNWEELNPEVPPGLYKLASDMEREAPRPREVAI